MGCKRILLSDDYYPALAQPNVVLETEPIARVDETSVITDDGARHELDALIFGTGFDVTGMPFSHKIRGRDGRTLADTWDGSTQAHLGTTVAGFPSLFLITGPTTGLGHSSVLLMIEAQIEHLLGALTHLDRTGGAGIEPRRDAQARFVAEIDRKMASTVWKTGCTSWYLDATGRNSTLWPGYTFSFTSRARAFDSSDYVTEARRNTKLRLSGAARAEQVLGRKLAELPRLLLDLGRVERDGLSLEPELVPILAARKLLEAPEISSLPPIQSRRRFSRDTTIGGGEPVSVGSVRDLELSPGLFAGHYAPIEGQGAPLVVFFHGGGFVIGDLERSTASSGPRSAVLARARRAREGRGSKRRTGEAPRTSPSGLRLTDPRPLLATRKKWLKNCLPCTSGPGRINAYIR